MTIEEIKKEKEEIRKEYERLNARNRELDDMLTSLYDGSNIFDTYNDKYLKLSDKASGKFIHCIHVNKIERGRYSDEELYFLHGPGFSFTLQDDGSLYSMSLDRKGIICTSDFNYYKCEFITKEEFQSYLIEVSEKLKHEKDNI